MRFLVLVTAAIATGAVGLFWSGDITPTKMNHKTTKAFRTQSKGDRTALSPVFVDSVRRFYCVLVFGGAGEKLSVSQMVQPFSRSSVERSA